MGRQIGHSGVCEGLKLRLEVGIAVDAVKHGLGFAAQERRLEVFAALSEVRERGVTQPADRKAQVRQVEVLVLQVLEQLFGVAWRIPVAVGARDHDDHRLVAQVLRVEVLHVRRLRCEPFVAQPVRQEICAVFGVTGLGTVQDRNLLRHHRRPGARSGIVLRDRDQKDNPVER